MPKKEWTDEERKAFAEKMRKAREKRVVEEVSVDTPAEKSNQDVGELQRQIDELKALIAQGSTTLPTQAQITATGLVGTVQKYNTDPSYYPDPTERLANEPKLTRFAFKENWELEFSVKTANYQTIDNRRVSEPQFTIQLIGKMFDENGDETNQRYVRKQMVFFEDPDAALQVARDNGLNVEDYQERAFLDEMRYLRVRDWLLENFYPPNHTSKRQNKKQQVIGNQVVEVYEIASIDRSSIPFNDLQGKVRG